MQGLRSLTEHLRQAGWGSRASILVTVAATCLTLPSRGLAAQDGLAVDFFGGATAAVGGLAEVTTGAPAYHVGAGLSVPVSPVWSLRMEASLHEFEERAFAPGTRSAGAPASHLQLWQFFVLARHRVASTDRLDVRLHGGPGLTRTGSDQVLGVVPFSEPTASPRRFSHSQPAVQIGVDAGYRVGPGQLFLSAGTVVTALTGEAPSFYRTVSDGRIGGLETLIGVPLSAGVRLTF